MKYAMLLVLCACGAPYEGERFPIELYMTAALGDEVSAFQLSLVTRGSSLDCVAVQKACIKDQVEASRFVPLKGADGQDHSALRFDLDVDGGAQDLTLRDLPIGKDYALVVEAISKDTVTPQLAGSSCNYIQNLTVGDNATVFAKIEQLTPRAACDPRH